MKKLTLRVYWKDLMYRKQLEKNVICYYCMGCNKLLIESFLGVKNCKGFVLGKDLSEYYKELKQRR